MRDTIEETAREFDDKLDVIDGVVTRSRKASEARMEKLGEKTDTMAEAQKNLQETTRGHGKTLKEMAVTLKEIEELRQKVWNADNRLKESIKDER